MRTVLSVFIVSIVMGGYLFAQPVDHGDYVEYGDGTKVVRFDSTKTIKPRPPQGEYLDDYIAIWDDEDIKLTYQNEEGRTDAQSPRALAINDTLYVYYNQPVFEPYSHGVVTLVRLFDYGQIIEYPEQVTDTTTGYILYSHLLHSNNNNIHVVAGGTHLHDQNDRFIHYSRGDMDGSNWQLRETWFDDHTHPTFAHGGGVGKEDTLFYSTYHFGDIGGRVDSVTFVRSFDSGSTWSEDRFIRVEYNPTFGASLAFVNSRLHFIGHVNEPALEIGYHYSDDLGDTWHYWGSLSSPDTISSQWPSLDVDEQGNMCACWFDYKYGAGPGGLSGTLLCRKSTDNGETWSDELIASDTNTAELNHIYVDGDYMLAVWFDNRDDGWLSPHIYYAESHDFGETWTASREIMDETSFKNWMQFNQSDGHLYLVWTDGRLGANEIYFKHGMLSQTDVEEEGNIPSSNIILNAYPNPLNSSTTISYSGIQRDSSTEPKIEIFDLMGRMVDELPISGDKSSGQITWNADKYPSGIYFARLKSGSVSEVIKLSLIK